MWKYPKHSGGDNMKNINWKTSRIVLICLTLLFAILSFVFRNLNIRNFNNIFMGLLLICFGLNSVCYYFIECKEKGSSSKFYILTAILFFILSVLYWLP